MTAVDLSTLPWGVVQNQFGEIAVAEPWTITTLANAPVLSGVTNAFGELTGALNTGAYKLTIDGRTKTVHVIEADAIPTDAALQAEIDARIAADANNPTAGEKAALAGTNGTPSSTNRYVTNSDPRVGAASAHATTHRIGGSDAIGVLALNDAMLLPPGDAGNRWAGRDFFTSDFIAATGNSPRGLWRLASSVDSSGNAQTLTNKGAVAFVPGITGTEGEAAQFTGATTKALYRVDAGAGDLLRIRTGSFGCWFRTAKRGVIQHALSKYNSTQNGYALGINASNVAVVVVAFAATSPVTVTGLVDVADDRWHFVYATVDGTTIRLFVDGILEATSSFQALIYPSSAPFNIGGYAATSSVATVDPFWGRIDEAFVTPDVINDDQGRYLMAAPIAHTLGTVPNRVSMTVQRRQRGGVLTTVDYPAPTSVARLYNFTSGSLGDDGANGVTLTSNPGTGAIVLGENAGPDGFRFGAAAFSGAHTGMTSTDTGLPAGLVSRSWGLWFKAGNAGAAHGLMHWGTLAANAITGAFIQNNGNLYVRRSSDGASDIVASVVWDGLWHFLVVTEEDAAIDGLKRKVYLDGRMVASDTTMATIVLSGASGFKVGYGFNVPLVGQLSRVFVYSGVLSAEDISFIYNKPVNNPNIPLAPVGSDRYVEALESNRLLCRFDDWNLADAVDLAVYA